MSTTYDATPEDIIKYCEAGPDDIVRTFSREPRNTTWNAAKARVDAGFGSIVRRRLEEVFPLNTSKKP
jgi:hypothetical protein